MIPLGDPLKAVLGIALIFGSFAAIVADAVMIVLALRRAKFAIAVRLSLRAR